MSEKKPESVVEMSRQKLIDYVRAARKDSSDKADTDRKKSIARARQVQKADIKLTTGDHVAEDAPANCAGGGAIAGIGVGPQGEPGVRRKVSVILGEKLRRRRAPVNAK